VKLSQMSGLIRLGVCLIAGAIISIMLLIHAVSSVTGPLILWLGLLSLGLISGGSLCLLLALARFFESRRRPHPSPGRINTHGEYVAEYSWANRGIAMGMTFFFAALVIFFLIRSGRLPSMVISTTLFSFAAMYLLYITGTRIRFAEDGFIARLFWFRQVSRPYVEIRRVSGKPGSVKSSFLMGDF